MVYLLFVIMVVAMQTHSMHFMRFDLSSKFVITSTGWSENWFEREIKCHVGFFMSLTDEMT